MKQEWFTPVEISELKLPALPTTQRGINKFAENNKWQERRNMAGDLLARKRKGRGGGWEYHYTVLPNIAQLQLIKLSEQVQQPRKADLARNDAWTFFDSLPEKKKDKAREKLVIIQKVMDLHRGGMNKNAAVALIGMQNNINAATIYRWFKSVEYVAQGDWLPYLAPRHAGVSRKAECPAEAWEIIKSDYLRAERPTFESCFRRLDRVAEKEGWTLPSDRTLKRRMDKEVSKPVQVLCRYGKEALKQMFPAQERDRSVFHALEAVNADGHRWDVWVEWPDGEVLRPCMTAIQDLYSGMFLSWRVDKSENKEAFRLALGDVFEEFGIMEDISLDNGRNFASKWLTGGIKNRFRFKIREDDPTGILTDLGVNVHWTQPYSGQSKPIERGFRDFCDNIAKHPALAGSWAGNSPVNKPDYKPKAVPLDKFLAIVEDGIVEHNERKGRRTQTANGRSFAETFRASYKNAPIRKATPEQRRMWLLAAEGVQVSKRDGTIKFMGNRYFDNFLHEHTGHKVIARFDPQNLLDGLHIYHLDGSYLGFAGVLEMAGFYSVDDARSHSLKRRQWQKHIKALKDIHVKMTGQEIADLIPQMAEKPKMDAKVVKMHRVEEGTMKADPVAPGPELTDKQKKIEAELIDFNSRKVVQTKEEKAQERFERGLEVFLALEADAPVDAKELDWFKRYSTIAEWKARLLIWQDKHGAKQGS